MHKRRIAVGALAVLVMCSAHATAATAASSESDLAAVEAASQASQIDLSSVVASASAGTVLASSDAEVSLPATTDEPMVLTGWTGQSIEVFLPSQAVVGEATQPRSSAQLPAGVATYEDADAGATHVPLVQQDGSVHVATIADLTSSALAHEYSLNVPEGATITQGDSGEVIVLDANDNALFIVAPPAAVDANGASVPSRITLHDGGFTQTTNADADSVYPIVTSQAMATNLINYFRWSGANIEIHVTAAMAVVSSGTATFTGWTELLNRQTPQLRAQLSNAATYNQQWACHAGGKAAIGFAGFLGLDPRPAWGLEGSRGTTWNYTHWAVHQCAW